MTEHHFSNTKNDKHKILHSDLREAMQKQADYSISFPQYINIYLHIYIYIYIYTRSERNIMDFQILFCITFSMIVIYAHPLLPA